MAISSSDLAKLRAKNQYANLWVFVETGNVIFQHTIVGGDAYDTDEFSFTFTAAQDLSSLHPGMLLHVGSATSRRAFGSLRIRRVDDTGDVLYLEPNNIAADLGGFAVGDVLTVDGVMQLSRILHHWADIGGTWTTFEDGNPASITGGGVAGIPGLGVDYHANYADPPQTLMGSHRAAWTGEWITLDASYSYATGGNAVSSYLWDIDGGTLAPGDNLTDATIQVCWTTPGDRLVRCTVRDDSARPGPDDYGLRYDEHTGLRRVIVRDRPGGTTPPYRCKVDRISGNYPGGWQASLTCFGASSTSEFPDSAIVVVLAEDYYDGILGSVAVPGYPHQGNILFVGYLSGDTVRVDAEKSIATFEAADITSLMKEIDTFPANFRNDGTPAQWHEIDDMRIEDIARHLCRWHSNLRDVADVFVSSTCGTSPGKRVDFLDITEADLYGQLADQLASCFYGDVVGSRYSSVHVVKNRNMRTEAERIMTPDPFMELAKTDWVGELEIGDERPREGVCQVDFVGFIYDANGNPKEVYSIAPRYQTNYGSVQKQTGILLTGSTIAAAQGEANELSGLYRAWQNIRFPMVGTNHANNRVFDPALQSYCSITLVSGDTTRGLVWTQKEFIIRRTEISHDPEHGILRVRNEWEASTWGPDGVAGPYPSATPDIDPTEGKPTNPESPEVFDPSAFENRDGAPWGTMYVACGNGHVYRATGVLDWSVANVVWQDLGLVDANGLEWIALDEYDPENVAMVAGLDTIYLTTNLAAAAPTWNAVRNRIGGGGPASAQRRWAQILSSPVQQHLWMAIEQGVEGVGVNDNVIVHWTTDRGSSWSTHKIEDDANRDLGLNHVWLEISSHDAQKAWATCIIRSGQRGRAYQTDDLWTTQTERALSPPSPAAIRPGTPHHRHRNNDSDANSLWMTANDSLLCTPNFNTCTFNDDALTAGEHVGIVGSYRGSTSNYYALTRTGTRSLYVSSDGNSWTNVNNFAVTTYYVMVWRYNPNLFFSAQYSSPNTPAGRSEDGGDSWINLTGDWAAKGYPANIQGTCCALVF